MRIRQIAGLFSTTAISTPTATNAPNLGIRRRKASTDTAASTAMDKATNGTARGVERSARPASLRVNTLNKRPASDGLSKGCAPTPTSAPTPSSNKK